MSNLIKKFLIFYFKNIKKKNFYTITYNGKIISYIFQK